MNRLLSFTPDPFETDLELAGALRADDATRSGPDPEGDFEYARGRPSVFSRVRRRGGPGATLYTAPFDSRAFRQRIVRIANQELARWGNGVMKETNPRTRRVLQDYWKTGVGAKFSEDQLRDAAFQKAHPWSAAFISWVMRTAGAGNAFKYSPTHAAYTRAAIDNRHANNGNPFKAYRVTELAPQVGDLVCKGRAGIGATYENIKPGMKTHCDIVTEVRPNNLTLVGGNVNNSVARKTLRSDTNGRIAEPDYFAVIRIGGAQPVVPIAPPRMPMTPSTGSAPKLIKQESMPTGTTLYVEIDLKVVDKFGIAAPPVTGIFIPDDYAPGAAVDLILYLHGHKAEKIRRLAIDQYWDSQRFPYGALREGVNASGRNVILVAPTLGSHSEAKRLLEPGGLDAYIAQVLAALHAHGPSRRASSAPSLGNLIFACHSGGGWPMRQLAGGSAQALARLRECWGYDCTYNKGDDAFWAGWARARPNARVYIYYIAGSPTARLAEALRDKRVPNAIVQPSRDRRHNYVPITHWKERIQRAPFLAARSGGAGLATQGGPEQESELEYVGARGRNLRFRRPSASSLRQAGIRADRRATHGPPTEAPFTTPVLVVPPAEQTIQRTVYGWSRYKRRVGELPPDQQAVLKGVGNAIIASYGPGGRPVRNVKIYGHADYDTPRNPQREQQYSEERAKAATDWLKAYVGASIAGRISWDTKGLGATQLKAPPTTEANRRQNRRVEILAYYSSAPMPPVCPSPPTSSRDFNVWLQQSLNQILGLRLPVDGVFSVQNRSALRSFQFQNGIPPTGTVDRGTQQALSRFTKTTAPCRISPDSFVVELEEPGITPQASESATSWKDVEVTIHRARGGVTEKMTSGGNGQFSRAAAGAGTLRVIDASRQGPHTHPIRWQLVRGGNTPLQLSPPANVVAIQPRLRLTVIDFNASFAKGVRSAKGRLIRADVDTKQLDVFKTSRIDDYTLVNTIFFAGQNKAHDANPPKWKGFGPVQPEAGSPSIEQLRTQYLQRLIEEMHQRGHQ
jgi:hypothetical protein